MWRIHHISETDSTNRLARDGKPGDVFTADYQSAGRGRLAHKWLSPPGQNLIMSAIIDVSGMEAAQIATFPLVVGLAVTDALAPFSRNLRLKWPNDIVLVQKAQKFRKLGGILCELHGENIIAGIGINVLQSEFPPEIASTATSLRLIGCETSVATVRDAILASLETAARRWKNDGFEALLPEISRLDALKGKIIHILRTDDDTEGVTGECRGIAPDGALLVGAERVYAGEAHLCSVGGSSGINLVNPV